MSHARWALLTFPRFLEDYAQRWTDVDTDAAALAAHRYVTCVRDGCLPSPEWHSFADRAPVIALVREHMAEAHREALSGLHVLHVKFEATHWCAAEAESAAGGVAPARFVAG